MPNLTYIIIVTYNGIPWIKRCLDSCNEYNVIVIDNASHDETTTFIETNYPDVIQLKQDKNLGFGQANNLGIIHALNNGAEYVFLLNQDAYLQKNTLKILIETNQNNPKFGILSPIHLNGEGKRLDKNFSNYVAYRNNPDFYSDFILEKSLSNVYEVPFVNAAGWLLTRGILESVGGFDPIFFHYGEDDNYCQRAIYHGFKIGVVPTAFMLHDREDRLVTHIEHGSSQYLDKLEKSVKIKFGNINLENDAELDALIVKRTKSKTGLISNSSSLRLHF